MRFSFSLMAAALAAFVWTSPVEGQRPLPPVSDPTVPLTVEAPGQPASADVPVGTSLMQDAQPDPPDRFKPLDELPPQEQYPAAPLIVAAYAFVMAALFVYMLSLAKRLGAVKQEVDRLERDIKKSGRA